MSDAAYAVCFVVVGVCGVVAPLGCHRLCTRREGRALWAVVAGFAAPLGFACSVPFQQTVELAWLPWAVGVWLAGTVLAGLLYGLAHAPRSGGAP